MNLFSRLLSVPFVGRMVNSKLGGFAASIGTSVVSFVVTFLAGHHLQLDDHTKLAVAAGVSWACTHLATGVIQYWQTGNAQALQGVLNDALAQIGIRPIEQDGWIGPETHQAAQTLVRKALLATDDEVAAALAAARGVGQQGTLRGK